MKDVVYWLFFSACMFLRADDCSTEEVIDYPTLNQNWSYCFEYTWFGPEYDNVTRFNGTCEDYKEESRAGDNIPCVAPLVISYDGTIPDVTYLWDHYKASVLCRRSESQACVTYTYWYNGLITNQTHMCARVRSDSKTISNECYKQKENGYEIEMCVCKSGYGLYMPCNSGSTLYRATVGIIFIALQILVLVGTLLPT